MTCCAAKRCFISTIVDIRQHERFHRGRDAEALVAAVLRRRGNFVVEVAGGNFAPVARGQDERFILPDLMVARNGKTHWIEVKERSPSYTLATKTMQVSIPEYQALSYRRCEAATGIPVWLAFVIVGPAEAIRICELSEHARVNSDFYWYDVDKLRRLPQ